MKLHFLDSWLDLCVKWNGQLWNGFTHVGPLYIIYGNQLSFSTLVIDYQMLFLQKIKNTVSSFSSLSKYKKCNWHHDHIFESTMNIRKPFFSPSTQNIYIYIFPRVNEHPLQLYLYFAKKNFSPLISVCKVSATVGKENLFVFGRDSIESCGERGRGKQKFQARDNEPCW